MRLVLLGATGHFGSIIARRLRALPGVELVVASRDAARTQALGRALGVESVVLDRDDPAFGARLRALAPDLVVSAAGPFQAQGYGVARACIEAGAHYVDIADAREFVCGIRALDEAARARGVCVVSGASSVPTLSSAVVASLATGLDTVDAIDLGISTSSHPVGEATLRAVLRDCGRPVPQWRGGRSVEARGSQGGWRRTIEGAGTRRFIPCDVPDLALLREQYPALHSLRFGAGSELGVVHAGLWMVAAAVRMGAVPDPARLAPGLVRAGRWLQGLGSGTSAMYVEVRGTASGAAVTRSWELVAAHEDGANIPCVAAVCLARKLAGGSLEARGAFPAAGLVTQDEYLRELEGLDIRVRASEDARS